MLAVLAAGAVLWVLVPVVSNGRFAARNEFLQGTVDADSFGARRILSWLVTGQLYDKGRLPVLTVFLLVGLVVCVIRFRRDERCRVLVVLWVIYLVAFFGRPTLGPVVDLLPGSRDLFLRRLVCGVDLMSLLLTGVGAVEIARLARHLTIRALPHLNAFLVTTVAVLCGVTVLAPAWTEVAHYAARNAEGHQLPSSRGHEPGKGGRVLVAGCRGPRWWSRLRGSPHQLGRGLSRRICPSLRISCRQRRGLDRVHAPDRLAYVRREPYFDDTNPGDYALFGVRYLLLPVGMSPPVRADLLLQSGPYTLWTLPGVRYVQVVDTVGSVIENRTDIGATSSPFLASSGPDKGRYLTVAYGGAAAAPPTLKPGESDYGPAGTVVSVQANLEKGVVTATIVAGRTAVVLLSASYDPGWRVTVDSKAAASEIVAPAMPGVRVSAGLHVVRFTYVGYQNYLELILLSVFSLATSAVVERALEAQARPFACQSGSVVRDGSAAALGDFAHQPMSPRTLSQLWGNTLPA